MRRALAGEEHWMPWKNGNPPLYHVWRGMNDRCYNPNRRQYKDYGGRGIKVCPQWRQSYKQFYADMFPSYKHGLTLDRIDNEGDYTSVNCHWATHKEQQRNQTRTRKLTVEGIEYLAVELSEFSKIKTDTLITRIVNCPEITLERLLSKKKFTKGMKEPKRKRPITGTRPGGTHCKRGHEFTAKNTYITAKGTRTCKKCHALRQFSYTNR